MDNSQEMVHVAQEKIDAENIEHMRAIWFDLECSILSYKFDMIYHQMVMHHVNDVDHIFGKFYSLLNPQGYMVMVDLYTEDGSFHGPDAKVFRGFDPVVLSEILQRNGFKNCSYKTCFEIKRENGNVYPIFMLVAQK